MALKSRLKSVDHSHLTYTLIFLFIYIFLMIQIILLFLLWSYMYNIIHSNVYMFALFCTVYLIIMWLGQNRLYIHIQISLHVVLSCVGGQGWNGCLKLWHVITHEWDEKDSVRVDIIYKWLPSVFICISHSVPTSLESGLYLPEAWS